MQRCTIGLLLAFTLLVAPLAADAQPAGKQPRIGFLSPLPSNALGVSRNLEAFRQGLHALGYVEGQHLILEYREAPPDRLAERAAELVRLPVDVLVTWTTPAIQAAKQATSTIPIVMAASGDPIRTGFAASLARPGGNITGLTIQSAELSAKRLELLTQLVPRLARVAVFWNPANPAMVLEWQETQEAARRLGVQVQSLEIAAPTSSRGPSPRPPGSTPRHSTLPPRPSSSYTSPRSSTLWPGADSRRASTGENLWRPGA